MEEPKKLRSNHGMKVLVLSDIHYPFTDMDQIRGVIKKEKPDKVVLLGDIIEKKGSDKQFFMEIKRLIGDNYYFLKGDEDKTDYGLESLTLNIGKKRFFFTHGNKLQGMNDKKTEFFVKILKYFHPELPLLLFAVSARIRKPFFREEIVLGHAHALARFKRLGVTCAGTLTEMKSLYNDKGYLIITESEIKLKTR